MVWAYDAPKVDLSSYSQANLTQFSPDSYDSNLDFLALDTIILKKLFRFFVVTQKKILIKITTYQQATITFGSKSGFLIKVLLHLKQHTEIK